MMGKKEMMALKEAEFVNKKIVDWEELSPHHRERTVEIWRMGFEDGWNIETDASSLRDSVRPFVGTDLKGTK